MTVKAAIELYHQYISAERRLAAGTVAGYDRDLHDLAGYLSQYGVEDLDQLTARELRAWQLMHMERGEHAGTVKRRLSSVSGWLRYLRRQRILDRDLMAQVSAPRLPRHLPVFFRESEVRHIYDDDLFDDDFWGQRDRLILRMLYETGMRRSELAGLRQQSIDMQRHTVKVLGKRNKERQIPLENELLRNISDYIALKEQEVDPTEWLFVGKRGGPMSPSAIYAVVRRYMSALSDADRVSPHVFRHSFATHILNQGGDLLAIKQLLGHEDLATTEVYTHLTREHLREVYRHAHPRSAPQSTHTTTQQIKEETTMNTIINTAGFSADEKLEKFINDKVAKLDRMIDRATGCEVFLKVDKPESELNKTAEMRLYVPGNDLFVTKKGYSSFEEAVTECIDAMKVQIEKYKNA